MRKSQTATSLASMVLAFLASSHHWLHMGILFLLGSSTSMMTTMNTVFWIRRTMIIMTILTLFISWISVYRHRCRDKWGVLMTGISTVISLAFVVYTLMTFGW